jgi:DNA-binding transcriptional LysR family regulator
VAIADQGTFAKAAKIVHRTPSAVSQQMQTLEQELGASIFDRSNRPPSLNSKGLYLIDIAKKVLQLVDDAKYVINEQKMVGPLYIGAVRTSASCLLPNAIVSLNKDFPDLKIKLRVDLSKALVQQVTNGSLDLAIVAQNSGLPPELQWNTFIREPLVVIAPKGTPNISSKKILETLPLIRLRSGVPLAELIDTELARMEVVPNFIAEIDTVASIVECVIAGLGAAVVPELSVRSISGHSLPTVPFGAPQIVRRLGIVRRNDSYRAQAITIVHKYLAGFAGTFGILPNPD